MRQPELTVQSRVEPKIQYEGAASMNQSHPTKADQADQGMTSTFASASPPGSATDTGERPRGKRRRVGHVVRVKARRSPAPAPGPSLPTAPEPGNSSGSDFARTSLTLKQKLAEVRRRISYIQKRGHNERYNYSYVTAADLAGAVGDALAELEVVVIPQLVSISHENIAPNQGYPDRLTRVVMTYTFMDVNSAEQLTVKVPGEGRDPGDKGPYKAMTGALKYALLQSFLIATGDDPEDERAEEVRHTGSHGNGASALNLVIGTEQLAQLRELIEQTGTDVARMLEYFKVSKIEEMTMVMYGRAIHALRRKQATAARNHGEAHAHN